MITNLGEDAAASIERLTREWYAGAELELIERHGIDPRDGAPYSGLGQAPVFVQSERRGRFHNVADELGLVGQRLAWAAKSIWTIIGAMGSPIGSRARTDFLSLAKTMAPRARAFRREILNRTAQLAAIDIVHRSILIDALQLVGRAGLQVRGVPPMLDRLRHCDYPDRLDVMNLMS